MRRTDVQLDGEKLNDLSDEHPERVRDLAAKYDAWAERSSVRPWSEMLQIRQQLRSKK